MNLFISFRAFIAITTILTSFPSKAVTSSVDVVASDPQVTGIKDGGRVFFSLADIDNAYPARTAKFSHSTKKATSYTNQSWLKLPLRGRAKFIAQGFLQIIDNQGLDPNYYNPHKLTCKVFKESSFRPQIGNKISSAAGFSQALKGTTLEVFGSRNKFRHKIKTFEHLAPKNKTSLKAYRAKLAGNMAAQMELGLGVLVMKNSRLKGKKSLEKALAKYFGAPEFNDFSKLSNKKKTQVLKRAKATHRRFTKKKWIPQMSFKKFRSYGCLENDWYAQSIANCSKCIMQTGRATYNKSCLKLTQLKRPKNFNPKRCQVKN